MNEETPTNTADVRNPPGAEEDMSVIYANNSHIDATIWDLQVILGEYSPSANRVDWHTTVTMPWAQAKLAVKGVGSRKIIFGSDEPEVDCRLEIFKVRVLKLPKQQEEMILGGNMARLLSKYSGGAA